MKFNLPSKSLFAFLGLLCLSTIVFGTSVMEFLSGKTLSSEKSEFNMMCDIAITDIAVIEESCSPGSDGSLTITATCLSCTNASTDIEYSINGGAFQSSNVFSGLTAGVYTVTVHDINDNTCDATSIATVFNVISTVVDDPYIIPEDQAGNFSVLDNDQDVCGSDRALVIVQNGTNGNAILGANNTLVYTPNADFSGCDNLQYAFIDPPAPTKANDDYTSTDLNTAVNINAVTNDTDPQNDPLSVTLVNAPNNGNTTLSGTTFTYTPNNNYVGIDVFSYEVSDGNGNTDQAEVIVTVQSGEEGKLFYLPEKWNLSNHSALESKLWLSTIGPDTANVTVTSLAGYSQTFQIDPTKTVLESLSSSTGNALGNTINENTINQNGIKVTSDIPINVQIAQEGNNGQSFLNSKGVNALGTKFFAAQQEKDSPIYETDGRSIISVMATEDNTNVTIERPPGTTWNWNGTASGTVNVNLDENESYLVSSANVSNVITGAKITSDKPITASSGTFGMAPATDNGWDNLVPVERIGSDYILFNAPSQFEEAYVIATEDNTEIFVNNISVGTFDEGEYYTEGIDNSATLIFEITSSKPVYVFQNAGERINAPENGFSLIAPIDLNGTGIFRFRTPDQNGSTIMLTATSAIPSMTITNLTDNNTIGFTSTAVPGRPDLSYIDVAILSNKEIKVESNSFVQIMMRIGLTTGGGISYISGFGSSAFVASDDVFTIVQNIPSVIFPTVNDVDAQGNPITISNFTQPSNGTLVDHGDGSFTYTPNANFTGDDSFSYTISNGNGFFSTATVTLSVVGVSVGNVEINVNPISDNPGITANNVSGNTGDNVALDITVGALIDNDGSESVDNVVISGVPGTVTLSLGTNDGSGNWTMTLAQSQTVTASGTSGGTFNLTATVNITDAATDCGSSAQSDTDGFSDAFTLSLTATCNISITSATPTDENCPGADDGAIDVVATCTTCTSIEYSIDDFTTMNTTGDFTGLADNTYTVKVRDSGDNSCAAELMNVVVGAGVDTEAPTITCPADVTIVADASDCSPTMPNLKLDATVVDNCPSVIPSASTSFTISSGVNHSLSIGDDGSLYSWGREDDGRLGRTNAITQYTLPGLVGSDTDWKTVAGGDLHSLVLKTNGELWAFGSREFGQLGDGTTPANSPVPIQIGTASNWDKIFAGRSHSVALKTDGTLWTWGRNNHGQLGDGTNSDRHSPTQLGTDNDWMEIACGTFSTFALKSDGTLWSWGANFNGMLGHGDTADRNTPDQVGTDTDWKTVQSGNSMAAALKTDGTLWSWGNHLEGRLGRPTTTTAERQNPGQVGTDTDWSKMGVGARHTMIIKADGTLWGYGRNGFGQVGNGTTSVVDAPAQIGTDTDWGTVRAGWQHTIALKSDASPLAWGSNNFGQVGNGTTVDESAPISISGFTGNDSDIQTDFEVTQDVVAGTSLSIGTTTITLSTADAANNSASCMVDVIVITPEMNIQGNSQDIVSGDDMPETTDDTDFGTITDNLTATRTFTIQNSGTADLNLSGVPIVDISGSADFSVTTQPSAASIASGGADLTFVVTYDPSDVGTDDATISIANNDCDEDTYTFDITAQALANCNIAITGLTPTAESCPDADDGTITVVATCTSCTNGTSDIEYSSDSTNWQSSNVLTGLADGSNTVYVRDANSHTCTDSDMTTIVAGTNTTYYADTDNDGFGDPGNTADDCLNPPAGFVIDNTDCDDTDGDEFPGQTWYIDADGDTYGGSSMVACERPTDGFLLPELASGSTGTDDCDDADADEYPGQTWYIDADNDGYGASMTTACERPAGGKLITELVSGSSGTDDCNDANMAVNIGATEDPNNGIDDNCNGAIDEVPTVAWVELANGTSTGSCVSNTDCCTQTFCFGLEYNPGSTGTMTSYTTGFITDCNDTSNPIASNASCVMDDNSMELLDCSNGGVLMNSSGVNGTLAITVNTPVIIHQICVTVLDNEAKTFMEDAITDISMAIDLSTGSTITEYPEFDDLMVSGNTPPMLTAGTIDACYSTIAAAEAAAISATTGTDDCSATVTYTASTSGTCSAVVTVTGSDDCGLTSEVTYNTKVDGSNPIANGSAFPTFLQGCSIADAPAAKTTVAELEALNGDLDIMDDCTTDANLTVSHTDSNNASCPIVITRIYSITDECSNVATFNHVIIINDGNAPVITGDVDDITIDACGGASSAPAAATTVAELEALAGNLMIADACGADADLTVTFSDDVSGSCPVIINRTYTIADACANPSTVTQMIQVNPPDNIMEVGGPVATMATMQSALYATPPPVLPTIVDGCNNGLTPTIAVIGGTYEDGDCKGTITYTYTYEDCVGRTLVWVYTNDIDCGVLNISLNLEGNYDSGSMSTTLNESHLLPGQNKDSSGVFGIIIGADYTPFGQPYQGAPWNYTGNLGDTFGEASSPNAPAMVTEYPYHVVDWILVTVREDDIEATGDVFTCAGWLHSNGEVTFPESCPDVLTIDDTKEYYILIEHRNHLPILNTALIFNTNEYLELDFTENDSYAPIFRFGQKELVPGVWGMYNANIDQANSRISINSSDQTGWKIDQNKIGYKQGDANMDGATNSADETKWKVNQNKTSGIKFD